MEHARLHLSANDAVRHAAPLAGVAAVAVLAAVELPGGRGAALGVAVRPGPGQELHPPVAPHQRAARRPQSSPSQVLSIQLSVSTVYCHPSGATAPPRAAARTGPCTRATAWGWTGWAWGRRRRGSSVTRRRGRAGSWTGARARPP